MRKALTFCFVLMMIFQLKSQEITDRIGVPGPIEFNGTEFLLSWSKQNSKLLYLQQFLPRDEKIENFNQLLNFSYLNKDIELEEAVRQKVAQVQKLQENMKNTIVNVTESPDGKEFIIDYTLAETPEKGNAFLEYNINRFKKTGTDNKSLLVLAYSKRIYGDTKYASKVIAKDRNNLMFAMTQYQIPTITLQNEIK